MRTPCSVAALAVLPTLGLACGGADGPPAATPAATAPAEAAPEPPRWGEDYDESVHADGAGYGYGHGGWGHGHHGGVPGGAPPPPPPPPTPPSLEGAWTSACVAGAAKGEHRRTRLTFTGTRWELSTERFGDAACTKRTSEVKVAGAFALTTPSKVVGAAWDATFTTELRTVTAADAKTAKALAKACGIKLTAKTATALPTSGCKALELGTLDGCATEHDLVADQGLALRRGARPADGGGLCAADRRPTALGDELTYVPPATPIPECDAFFATFERYARCPALGSIGASMGEQLRQMMHQYAAMIGPSPSPDEARNYADACRQGSDAITQQLAAMGC